MNILLCLFSLLSPVASGCLSAVIYIHLRRGEKYNPGKPILVFLESGFCILLACASVMAAACVIKTYFFAC